MAIVATLSKGYDLDYIWKQVDRDPAKDAASYYIQASETGGEPPGHWWGPGARALGFEPGQAVERKPYDLLFGERKSPDGTQLGRLPGNGRKAADQGRPVLIAVVVSGLAGQAGVLAQGGVEQGDALGQGQGQVEEQGTLAGLPSGFDPQLALAARGGMRFGG